MQQRLSQSLQAVSQQTTEFYETADAFHDDLLAIKNSLLENDDAVLISGDFEELLQAVEVFGFYLATIDMRQDSSVHEACVAELLKSANIVDNYSELTEFFLKNCKKILVPCHQLMCLSLKHLKKNWQSSELLVS